MEEQGTRGSHNREANGVQVFLVVAEFVQEGLVFWQGNKFSCGNHCCWSSWMFFLEELCCLDSVVFGFLSKLFSWNWSLGHEKEFLLAYFFVHFLLFSCCGSCSAIESWIFDAWRGDVCADNLCMRWLIVVLGAWIWKPWKLELRSIWKDYSSVNLLLLVWNCMIWLCVTRQGGPGSAGVIGITSISGLINYKGGCWSLDSDSINPDIAIVCCLS